MLNISYHGYSESLRLALVFHCTACTFSAGQETETNPKLAANLVQSRPHVSLMFVSPLKFKYFILCLCYFVYAVSSSFKKIK